MPAAARKKTAPALASHISTATDGTPIGCLCVRGVDHPESLFDVPVGAEASTVEQADPFAPDPTEDISEIESLRAQLAVALAELESLRATPKTINELRASLGIKAAPIVDAPGGLCPAHFPDGWPEGQAAVSCQHGDDHRVYYVNGNPPAAQKTTGMRGVVEAFDPAAWPDEV